MAKSPNPRLRSRSAHPFPNRIAVRTTPHTWFAPESGVDDDMRHAAAQGWHGHSPKGAMYLRHLGRANPVVCAVGLQLQGAVTSILGGSQ